LPVGVVISPTEVANNFSILKMKMELGWAVAVNSSSVKHSLFDLLVSCYSVCFFETFDCIYRQVPPPSENWILQRVDLVKTFLQGRFHQLKLFFCSKETDSSQWFSSYKAHI
jgi:hypothetical protein